MNCWIPKCHTFVNDFLKSPWDGRGTICKTCSFSGADFGKTQSKGVGLVPKAMGVGATSDQLSLRGLGKSKNKDLEAATPQLEEAASP